MKTKLKQSQILLQARHVVEEQEQVLAQLKANRSRMRKRSQVNQRDPLQGPEGAKGNVLLPGHAHPTEVKTADIHSDLRGNVTLRADQTFFEEASDNSSNGGSKPNELLPEHLSTSKKPQNGPDLAGEDGSRAPSTVGDIREKYPWKSMIASDVHPEGDQSSQTDTDNPSQLTGGTGCKLKEWKEKAHLKSLYTIKHPLTLRILLSPRKLLSLRILPCLRIPHPCDVTTNANHIPTSTPTPANTTESGRGHQSSTSSSISANSTHLPPERVSPSLSRSSVVVESSEGGSSVRCSTRARRSPPPISPTPPALPDLQQADLQQADLQQDHQDISPNEIDELMNRVASVQVPKKAHHSKMF
ncbi:hypothetical protein PSHT_10724 [Puccinia striiformis]|uniref:Uncharacterized protein n=1 Tax=Puccinia striiformis TaxID=27350 RepID=A0A2S4V827_9BASI|nr:hypothetical protein PSHT_10724 [Puccinia striiformis]